MISIGETQGLPSAAYHRDVMELALSPVVGGSNASAGSPPELAYRVHSTGGGFEIPNEDRVTKWSNYLENEFQRLIALKSERKANDSDVSRLARFRRWRQRFKNPMSAEQMLFDFKARDLRQKALAAVEEYVHFIQKPSNS